MSRAAGGGNAPFVRSALALASFLSLLPGTDVALAADVVAGRQKAAACVTCHGESGISTMPNAPHLAGQPAIYVAEQLRLFRSGRRPSEVMAVIAKPLTDRDIDDLAAWYEAIRIEAKPPS
jgi:cytochrome c553